MFQPRAAGTGTWELPGRAPARLPIPATQAKKFGFATAARPGGPSTKVPASQAWHHVVFAVDSIGGRLYVDGDLQAETPWDGEPGSPTTNYLWQFAGSYEWADTLLGYQGALDDIAVWSEALSTEEVEELYEEQ